VILPELYFSAGDVGKSTYDYILLPDAAGFDYMVVYAFFVLNFMFALLIPV